MDATILGALAVIAGIVVSAALNEWQTRGREARAADRDRARAVSDWRRQRIRDTRLGLRRQLAQFEALALGNMESATRHSLAYEDLDVDIALVGDESAVRNFQSVLVDHAQRLGRGLPPEYAVRAARALQRVLDALDRQEERLLKGEEPVRIDPAAAPDLFSPEGLAARLDVPWRLPSLSAVGGRIALDMLRWLGHQLAPNQTSGGEALSEEMLTGPQR